MNVDLFLKELRASPDYRDQIVHVRETPAQAAQYAPDFGGLPEAVQSKLKMIGIERLYSHQAQAIRATLSGQDVLISTGTASGKSLCYLAPILDLFSKDVRPTCACDSALRTQHSALPTALLLFPMKALCQDQHQSFRSAVAGCQELASGVFDGDTPPDDRRRLRDKATVLFSNPDMLHAGLMPQHARWARFLARLKYLVLDELHVYSGIFGANMANLLRRFERLCKHYGSRPQIIACSATIGNPLELARWLTGREFTLVDRDGSSRGRRVYVFWNPPLRGASAANPTAEDAEDAEKGIATERNSATSASSAVSRFVPPGRRLRRSANVEAHELMAALIERGAATITFSKAKVTAELIYRYVQETLQKRAPQLVSKVTPYRGGYLAEDRREIERRLFFGELLGVSSTRALELGINVGGLDACVIVGYPGTRASFCQQGGRAGRGSSDALVILVGLDTTINQYVMSHPDYLFGRAIEEAIVDVENPFVLLGQLRCAAHEAPLADGDVPAFGPHAPMVLRILQENGKLRHIRSHWYHAASETPQHEVSLRCYADKNVVIQEAGTGAVLGELTKLDAPSLLYKDAIYLHAGETYRVISVDYERYIATVQREEVSYYTNPLGGTDVDHIDAALREKPFGAGRAFWGEVTAHFDTYMYERIRFYELDVISRHGVDVPRFYLDTMAFWLVPPEKLMADVLKAGLNVHAGLRGIGYATRMLLPLFITCDTADFSHSVGCLNAPWNALFIYERHPMGLGYTHRAYDSLHKIMPAVRTHIVGCSCADGCPCCVGKPLRQEATWNVELSEGNIPSKAAALMILDGLLGDGSALQCADTTALSSSPQADALRLEQALRRRLERMREPDVKHPIAPQVPTAYPAAEPQSKLGLSDVARRVERRGDFEKGLRKRLAEKVQGATLAEKARRGDGETGGRGETADAETRGHGDAGNRSRQEAGGSRRERQDADAGQRGEMGEGRNGGALAAPEPRAKSQEPGRSAIAMGDSLAARARKMKRRQPGQAK
ncbi:MAG TPA: DEAD/DEAH box helicase [Planctomycetota bacterium]|jgi:DEAD/DEAH box helicase domain-containing protein